jgi:hypothetical protein
MKVKRQSMAYRSFDEQVDKRQECSQCESGECTAPCH